MSIDQRWAFAYVLLRAPKDGRSPVGVLGSKKYMSVWICDDQDIVCWMSLRRSTHLVLPFPKCGTTLAVETAPIPTPVTCMNERATATCLPSASTSSCGKVVLPFKRQPLPGPLIILQLLAVHPPDSCPFLRYSVHSILKCGASHCSAILGVHTALAVVMRCNHPSRGACGNLAFLFFAFSQRPITPLTSH